MGSQTSGLPQPATADDVDEIKQATCTPGPVYHNPTGGHATTVNHPANMHQLSLTGVSPASIQIRSLSVTVDTSPNFLAPSTYPALVKSRFRPMPETKTLLDSISASLKPGTLTAILGGSGSGKTTLLNTISERMTTSTSTRVKTTGGVTFNGTEGLARSGVRAAYVMQTDVLIPTLTVRETLTYSARLRLPGTSNAEIKRVVEEVILELGLKECAETRIGNHQHKGCSGGEKRRVSVAVQMLSNPSVLFLDEPTTGLDASSAYQLVRTLKGLAESGRTVVMTIHQPRSEIWDMLDEVVVLSRGGCVYSGLRTECLPWFQRQGFEIGEHVNPAEFVVDVAAVDNRSEEAEKESTERVERLKTAWADKTATKTWQTEDGEKRTETAGLNGGVREPSDSRGRATTSFSRQLRVLTGRAFKVTYRDPMGMAAALLEAVLMGIVSGYIFFNLSRDQSGIRSREGALYTASALQGYLYLVFEVYRLTIDIPTFDREHSEGCADPLPFLLSRRLSRLFTEDFPVPFLFSVIFYFMAGFDRDPNKFFIFFSIVLLNHYISITCAMACVSAVRNFPGASLISNLLYTLQSVACGYLIQTNTIPIYVRWLKWISYAFYVMSSLCANEFENSFYDCPDEGGPSNPACLPYTGGYILESLGFPRDWVTRPIIILFAFVVLFYALAWIGLTFLKVEMTISRARTSGTDLSAGKEKMTARSIADVRAIEVGLQDFGLQLEKRSALGKKLPTKTILTPITGTFEAGVLNVIMGPSGSGKTSLLNAMALRLDESVGTHYLSCGKLLFNGAQPSDAVVRSVCSYVCQDDDALLPSLTVRETLRFAAGLRLPSWMSKEEKNNRAEEVLLKMGLKDCADNLVGNELVKGISGGEKRRVTIAVQILTEPRVLLLDEPTSGLDAFTASSILEVLQGLANEGRTLILTIHQARSDTFRQFGNVMLLARGGWPAYSGPAKEMLPYFGKQGYICPSYTNPADFALDLITVDLQEAQREASSREKVQQLITSWHDHNAPLTSKNTTLSLPAELASNLSHPAPLSTTLPLLLRRSTINLLRSPSLLLARTMQVIGLGTILTLFIAPMSHTQESIQTRIGFTQQIGALYFVGMLQNVAVYPAERDVFYAEQDDGVYSVLPFALTYTLLELPTGVIGAMVFGLLGSFAVGLAKTAEMYFVAVLVCFSIVSCGESLGVMFNTLFSSYTGFAINIMGILLSVAQTMGGVMSIQMPAVFDIFNWISPIRYSVRAFALVSLKGVVFTCEQSVRESLGGRCPINTGEEVLSLWRLEGKLGPEIAGLVGCVVVYRVLAWGLVWAVRRRWRG